MCDQQCISCGSSVKTIIDDHCEFCKAREKQLERLVTNVLSAGLAVVLAGSIVLITVGFINSNL